MLRAALPFLTGVGFLNSPWPGSAGRGVAIGTFFDASDESHNNSSVTAPGDSGGWFMGGLIHRSRNDDSHRKIYGVELRSAGAEESSYPRSLPCREPQKPGDHSTKTV